MISPIMEEGVFSQMCQVPGFNDENGHTYRDYLLKVVMTSNISQVIKEKAKVIKESSHILKLIETYTLSQK